MQCRSDIQQFKKSDPVRTLDDKRCEITVEDAFHSKQTAHINTNITLRQIGIRQNSQIGQQRAISFYQQNDQKSICELIQLIRRDCHQLLVIATSIAVSQSKSPLEVVIKEEVLKQVLCSITENLVYFGIYRNTTQILTTTVCIYDYFHNKKKKK